MISTIAFSIDQPVQVPHAELHMFSWLTTATIWINLKIPGRSCTLLYRVCLSVIVAYQNSIITIEIESWSQTPSDSGGDMIKCFINV